MESGRPRADFWCERTDAEYIRHMHTKHKLWLWKEVSKAEQITCGSTQTYEHNTYSPLRKSTLQQSKQEAKVSNDQTAPVLLQPAQWKYWSEQFLKMYLLSELPWRLRFKCELRLPSMAIANVSHTMNTKNWIPFQRMHTARKKSWTCVLNKDHLFFISAGVKILFTNRI